MEIHIQQTVLILQEGEQGISNQGQGTGKREVNLVSEFGTLQDHSELRVVTLPDTVSWPLA